MRPVNMIYDLSNLVWSTRHGVLTKKNKRKYVGLEKELLLFEVIQTMKRAHSRYVPNGILIACDGKNYWREDIYPAYKGNRDSERDEYYPIVNEVMALLIEFFNAVTNIPAVLINRAEADDIIAVASRLSRHKTVIVSSDKDFIQLLTKDVTLYAHTLKKDKERKSDDVGFDLFEKCIRGDLGDNIPSAFPNVRRTKLLEAWNSPVEMINLMETVSKVDGERVGDKYEFNKTLIDLHNIPSDLQQKITQEIADASIRTPRYTQLGILSWLGAQQLKSIASDMTKFAPIFKKGFIL